MPDPSFPVLLKKGIAGDLAATDLGVYKTGEPYEPDELGIFTNGPELPTTVKNCIVLTALNQFYDGPRNRVQPIQFRIRVEGTLDDANDLAEAIRARYENRRQFTLNGLTFRYAEFARALPITDDGQGLAGYFTTIHFFGRQLA